MKSWICSKCGGGKYFGILHNCKEEEVRENPEKINKVSDMWYCSKCKRYIPDHESTCFHSFHGCNPAPTHTVELTEEERDEIVKILYAVSILPEVKYKSILAKLRPKKESVDIKIEDRHRPETFWRAHIDSDWIHIGHTNKKVLYDLMMNRPDFEKLIAAYHAHVDEVK